MPVDLSPAGRPNAYPRRSRLWPWWFFIWLGCNVFGATIALLLWPKDQPTGGAWFWFCVVGAPNSVFLILFGIERAGYEGLWYRAYFHNQHRSRWLAERLRAAQKPLQVLGIGYCLPLGGQSLSHVLAAGTRLPASRRPRTGSGLVGHTRFEDVDWMVEACNIDHSLEDSEARIAAEGATSQVSLLALKIAQALEPLAENLRALTRYERIWWPQVRVLSVPGKEQAYVAQVGDALRVVGLPPLAVQATSASDGLLVADAWLDAREPRPLLVVATAWHEDDGPPEGSAEGCVALLLAAGFLRLPESVRVAALLHRPVAGVATEIEYGFANAAVWGKANFASIARAWITRPVEGCNKALRAAHIDVIAKDDAQRRADLIVGDLGDANGWLSVAAAIESGAADGPQLIVDGLQSAILRVTPVTLDIDRISDDRSQAHHALA